MKTLTYFWFFYLWHTLGNLVTSIFGQEEKRGCSLKKNQDFSITKWAFYLYPLQTSFPSSHKNVVLYFLYNLLIPNINRKALWIKLKIMERHILSMVLKQNKQTNKKKSTVKNLSLKIELEICYHMLIQTHSHFISDFRKLIGGGRFNNYCSLYCFDYSDF